MVEENKEGMENIEQVQNQENTQEESQGAPQESSQETTQAQETSQEVSQEASSEEMSPEDLMALWEEALKEAQSAEPQKEKQQQQEPKVQEEVKSSVKEPVSAQPANLEELSPAKSSGVHPELEFILDIPLEISVEIGRTKMLIRDLLKLNQGSIIEIEKFAGEPVEVYVNGKLMAKGEVVVVNDRFGVRITEIISAQERIKRLGS